MTRIQLHSKALDSTIAVARIIGTCMGESNGPTLIFMGGIHGNEPAGVFALQRVIRQINQKQLPITGNIYCIAGNLAALKASARYLDEDLNRMWTKDKVSLLPDDPAKADPGEQREQIEIYNQLRSILKAHSGPFYFFDIHTTSSESLPFLTVNDSLLNRDFTSQYPLPVILGIEEYLNGPILSYINELGYVAFGFEAGQHDSLASIENAEAFCYLSLVFCGALDAQQIDYRHYYDLLAKMAGDAKHIYEIYYRYHVKDGEHFRMLPGFFNFQKVSKNQLVANSDGKDILAKENGRIFMPLYQSQGSDGFFTIRRIKSFFIRLSARIRKHKLDHLLVWLPGISWLDQHKSALVINKNVARFMAKQFMHLLGYRSIERGEKYLLAYNREANARTQEYADQKWVDH